MAADNSPPRIRPILATALIAVVVLVGLKFVFDSYYLAMFEDEEFRKVGSVSPVALLALHTAEQKSLANAPIPIDRAMQLVAKGRAEPIPGMQHGGITPEPSNDEAALIGWAQSPHVRPTPAASASPEPSSVAPASSASGSTTVPSAPSAAVVPVPSAVSSPRPKAPPSPSASPSASPRHP